MSMNSMLKKMVSSSLILAVCGHAAASMPIAVIAYTSQAVFASSAAAASETRRNAQGLLSDMRVSFGLIARSYKENAGVRHRSATVVLEAVTRAAKATQQLDAALAAHKSKAIAEATGNLSRAIGELQTRYALTLAQNDQAARGMRYLNAAWKTYSSRYILSKPPNATRTVSKAEVRALRKKVAALEGRVASLEGEVATNASLRREVVRLRQDLAYYDTRADDYWTYQSMLLTLTVVSGSFDALAYTTRTYYPTYYVYFEPVGPDFHVWHSYWDGYYDGYYDGRSSVWYDEQTIVDSPLVEITQIEVNQEITYQAIYNVTDETRIEYEALPQETLTEVDIPVAPEDTVFSTQALSQTEPDDVARQADETAPAAIDRTDDTVEPGEAPESAVRTTPEVIAPLDKEDHPDGPQTSDQGNERDAISDGDRDDASEASRELPEQSAVPSEEERRDPSEISAPDQDQQQETRPKSDEDGDGARCREGEDSC
ncbi:hypothetical protein BJ928_1301 [Rhizobium sp. WW_1]|nr:hypothetical protein BJ928_1301 [Rhizobium sp. WW_1]